MEDSDVAENKRPWCYYIIIIYIYSTHDNNERSIFFRLTKSLDQKCHFENEDYTAVAEPADWKSKKKLADVSSINDNMYVLFEYNDD